MEHDAVEIRVEVPGSDHPYLIAEIWRQESAEGDDKGCTGFLTVARAPKAFIRCWDNGTTDWGWGMHESAQKIWPPNVVD